MGACESSFERIQMQKSKAIDKQIKKESEVFRQKLLLLGAGESGKSTCLKQMQLLHNNGFSKYELEEKKPIVFSNIVSSMTVLLDAIEEYGIMLNDQAEKYRQVVMNSSLFPVDKFTSDLLAAIKFLWRDSAIQKIYQMRNQFQFPDSAIYFFENIDRIGDPCYIPNAQDILHVRVPTAGVVRITFLIREIQFEVFDVGGQRSERRKWIHCFDDVNGIIFIVAISEYDQVLREDNKTNRLMEALNLYDGICNSSHFERTSMILFLNKKDLFAEKIVNVSLRVCFPSYKGNLCYEEAVDYLRRQFTKFNRQKRKVYMHETCATDTDQVTVVINSVIDTIIQENLKDTGMI